MAADPLTANTVGELLNYDVSDSDDPFAETRPSNRSRDDKATLSPRAAKRKADDDEDKENFGLGLGLDEEVKITKKRKPVAKLDENRLLSAPGIPKLIQLARSGQLARKLRLKGKGHEFTDAAKLLTHYQLWLDDLYPRAKFADGLMLVEKVGHSKRMQVLRKGWIDEGKPSYILDREERKREAEDAARREAQEKTNGVEAEDRGARDREQFSPIPDDGDLFFRDTNVPRESERDEEPDDDELDALLAEQMSRPRAPTRRAEPESEGEDDLDALLAEQDARRLGDVPSSARPGVPLMASRTRVTGDDDDGDLEAVLAEQDVRNHEAESVPSTHAKKPETPKRPSTTDAPDVPSTSPVPDDMFDEDDLDLLAEPRTDSLAPQSTSPEVLAEETAQPPATPTKDDSQSKESGIEELLSSPIPNDDDDGLEDLLPEPTLPASLDRADTLPDQLAKQVRIDSGTAEHVSPAKADSQNKESTNGIVFSSSPIPNELGLDDLDALLDEQERQASRA